MPDVVEPGEGEERVEGVAGVAVERLLLPFLVLVRGGCRPCGVCHGARALRKSRGLTFFHS